MRFSAQQTRGVYNTVKARIHKTLSA